MHLERRAKDSVNWEKDRKWNHAFLEWLTSTIHLRKQQQGKLSPEQLAEIRQRYDEIIALGEQEYDYDPVPEDGYKHGRNLLKTLRERGESVLNCLDKPWLPHHNNPAEGGLRPIKRHTRAAVTNRSREEAHAYCAFLTVIKTADIQGKRVFPLIKEIMSRPAPRSKASRAMQFESPTRKPSDSRPAA